MDISTAWNNTYTAITAGVSDPETRSKKWVYGTYPDVYAKDFNGFPIIVITPFSQRDTIITLKNDTKRKEYISEIEVFTKSAQVGDILVASIVSILGSVSGLNIDKVESIGYRQVEFGGKVLHVRNILARWFAYD